MTAAIAIFTAVQLESRAVASALRMKVPRPGMPTSHTIGGLTICSHLVGIGAPGLGSIAFEDVPKCVVMAGFAGALDPERKVGDVVLNGVRSAVMERSNSISGRFHTSDQVICTSAQKSELFQSTGACAVDMETEVVERWARRQNIPFIAVRAISDSAGDELDPRLLSLIDQWGRPRAGKLAKYLLGNPLRARELTRLLAASRFAAENLGSAVRDLIDYMATTPDNLWFSS